MTTKNLGPGVSGYLDPEGRAWETAVYQEAKPLLDKELNLSQDIEQDWEARFRRRTLPSGWLADDLLNVEGGLLGIQSFFTASAVANELILANDMRAHVNGWLLRIGNTSANGSNKIDMGASPAGAGAKRTDLVILEVWRRLLGSTSTGKSGGSRIWWYGNVKVAGADDLTLNFADDIVDGTVGSETTKRVQVQYRLRRIQGVDIFAHPYGISDPTIVARSVPTNAATPDGSATLFTYTNQSASNDPGLWVAGDGDPANTLGTVDGYMYAVPLCAVFRRNTTAFDRNTNHNGGAASPAGSDRPDGLWYNIIDARDIIDLRTGVSPSGWNYPEILEKSFNSILDNQLLTDMLTTTIGGGVNGHLHLWADEIGITNAHGGDGVTTGDTPGAEFIGEFDAARRYFSDRADTETIVVKYNPSGANWANNEVVSINPSSLPIYPYAAFNWASYAPSSVSILEIDNASFIGPGAGNNQEVIGADSFASGLATVPVGTVTLNIGTVPAGITNEPLYIRLLVAYPTGVGLTKTPTNYGNIDGSGTELIVNNPGQLPAGAPILYRAIQTKTLDKAHRELRLTYQTQGQTLSFSAIGSGPTSNLTLPERVLSFNGPVTVNGGAYGGVVTISSSGYSLNFSVPLNPGDFTTVLFNAERPFPQNGEQITYYYYAAAPQPAREALIGTTLSVIPRHVSPFLYVMTVGSGSQGTAYPFDQQYVQMPGIYPSSGGTFSGDHELDAPGRLILKSFTTNGGFVKLPCLIPMVASPDQLGFIRAPGDLDIEGRTFFKEIPANTYLPNAFAEPIISKTRHRCVLPILAELTADSTLGKKGQLVLLAIGLWYPRPGTAGTANAVAFNPDLSGNVTSVSVYRIKGNLLNRRST